MRDARVEEVGTFAVDSHKAERIVAYGVGPSDDALALVVGEHASVAVQYLGSRADRVDLVCEVPQFPCVQPFPRGEVLIVESRCERYEDGTRDRSGCVYGPDGTLRREFLLGDGIEDVQATADGRIWVSYFDEGIFGGEGWGGADGPKPIGASGLICWSADGTKEWEYQPPPHVGYIDDCDALNVAEDATWACYHSGYPLIRIANNEDVRAWTTPVHLAHALAIGDEDAVFYGGPSGDRNRCVLLEFGDQALVERQALRLIAPSGGPLTCEYIVGRGPFLNLFDGPRWYRLDVRTLTAA